MSILYRMKISFFEGLQEILRLNGIQPGQAIDINGNGIEKDYEKTFTFSFNDPNENSTAVWKLIN